MRAYSKALEIRQANLPSLTTSNINIASVYSKMREYSKALSFYEQGLEIDQRRLLSNHLDLVTSYKNVASVHYNMKEYSKALAYLERALDLWQRALPPTHPNIKNVIETTEIVKKKL
ncbi:unnamed protein product [Adineta steineri]|uniref:Tetratricopeptide repeat protein n=1 Tax=Adineta steineri TaxID=433720 RepID=A0A815J9U4_9BILA|nr:unnamed protein product [Adineta steineri]CAF1379490.1 unnamed protein product [Adineta steineri]CAF1451873.1 unnamed protein product [Adineta steineri]CAF3685086.1 unnamed protein product [Adineta steineri]CAF4012203.1 unnamed protein product [Adineta steineri]